MKEMPLKEPRNLKQIHELALKRFERIMNRESDQRNQAVRDREFLYRTDGMWESDVVNARKNRPRYTVDRISPARDQFVGDQRQTNIGIDIISYGSANDDKNNDDEQNAENMAGLIREIEQRSKARHIYSNGYLEQIEGGIGGWRVMTKRTDNDIFKLDIVLKPIYSAASTLFFDINAQEYSKSDAKYAFVTTDILIDDFREMYPNASVTNFEDSFYRTGMRQRWVSESSMDTIKIAEYWVKEPVKRRLGLLSDGRVIDLDEEMEALDELLMRGITVVEEREVESHNVVSYIMNGAEIVKGPQKWPGKFIPLVPVYGKTAVIEGKTYVHGIVRKAKDPQRIYNYATSANVEAVALSPKDPIWLTPKQQEGLEEDYKNFLVTSSPFMRFNVDPENPGPPTRTGAPSVQTALIQQITQAATDLHATTGVEPASLGNSPELRSGKAIERQQAMGDRGGYVYTNNLAWSIEYTGEILADLIPRVYTGERISRVLRADGSTEKITLNETVTNQDGSQIIINDLSQTRYGVKASVGPAYATRRRESAEQLMQLAANSPEFARISMDLIARSIDMIDGNVLHKRIRRLMLTDGLLSASEATDEEREELGLDNQQTNPQQQAMLDNILLQNTKLQADIENKDADTQSKLVKSQRETIEALSEMIEALKKQAEMGVPMTAEQRDNFVKQNDIVSAGQNVIAPGPNSEQAADIAAMLTDRTE